MIHSSHHAKRSVKSTDMCSTCVLVILALSGVFVGGCTTKENPIGTNVSPITDDLFPFTEGHQMRYRGYLRDKNTDLNIDSTGQAYSTVWSVISDSSQAPIGGNSVLVTDTTLIPSGLASPPTIQQTSLLYFRRNPPSGSSNFLMLKNIGRFFRTYGIQQVRSDSLVWILLANLDAGLHVEWNSLDSTYATPTSGNVRLRVVGQFVGIELLTLGGETFQTYKLELVQRVTVASSVLPDVPMATFWLSPNVGPVRMILNSDGDSYGHYREFKSKNF